MSRNINTTLEEYEFSISQDSACAYAGALDRDVVMSNTTLRQYWGYPLQAATHHQVVAFSPSGQWAVGPGRKRSRRRSYLGYACTTVLVEQGIAVDAGILPQHERLALWRWWSARGSRLKTLCDTCIVNETSSRSCILLGNSLALQPYETSRRRGSRPSFSGQVSTK